MPTAIINHDCAIFPPLTIKALPKKASLLTSHQYLQPQTRFPKNMSTRCTSRKVLTPRDRCLLPAKKQRDPPDITIISILQLYCLSAHLTFISNKNESCKRKMLFVTCLPLPKEDKQECFSPKQPLHNRASLKKNHISTSPLLHTIIPLLVILLPSLLSSSTHQLYKSLTTTHV